MTPHIKAKKEDIAKFVLMPGDPLRAKVIAEKFLQDVRLVNDVRNMFMYTGYYKGIRITVAGSGMGCPSIGIYSYELYKFYDVDAIIRIGSAGSYKADIDLYSIYNVKEAYSESTYAKVAAGIDSEVIEASRNLFETINETAEEKGQKILSGRIHSSDVFYREDSSLEFTIKHNLDVVEMESFALFTNAITTKKMAACLLTVSDNLITHKETSADDRQNNFMGMVELALESVLKLK
ncbi:purine nucleoside phosphorylase [Entomoplasma ellychniae]|uniref:Uridine phosphorylase n=2 Tax=Entomoplasmataceae TaxID=33925 RepID=A0A2S5RHF8_9MOLU|nr:MULTISPECIES: purine-nucleoside phosphorylase [Entomoplasmataceae]PPE04896.1 purine nucleoside phosphorylase [Entomoplasma ellychniae]PPE06565.1 purine nucleoside phosphorylase [Mesoplasma corruscae]